MKNVLPDNMIEALVSNKKEEVNHTYNLDQQLRIVKALNHERRIQIIDVLREGTLSTKEVVKAIKQKTGFRISMDDVYKHLILLEKIGVTSSEIIMKSNGSHKLHSFVEWRYNELFFKLKELI